MTAINTLITSAAGYMITDAASYYVTGAQRGVVAELAEKAIAVPRLRMAIASCGAPEVRGLFVDECRRFESFDEALLRLPQCGREMAAAGYFRRTFDGPLDDHTNRFRLFAVGWSRARKRPEAYVMQNIAAEGDGTAVPPFTMVAAPGLQCQPGGVSGDVVRKLGYREGGLAVTDPSAFLAELIEWQRNNCRFEHVDNHFCIGGHATVFRVDSKRVTQRLVRRWDDRVGQTIDPHATSKIRPAMCDEGAA